MTALSAAKAAAANLQMWPAGRPLVRCYYSRYGPTAFNATTAGSRFRPIKEPDTGIVVPTAYAGEDDIVAIAESVLRDSVVAPGGVLPAVRLKGLALVRLTHPQPLTLAALNGLGLRKLELTRGDIIDTPAAYPDTAGVAQALYDAQPTAQGLLWTSHQADHGDAVILWQTRIDTAALAVTGPPLALDSSWGLRTVARICEACDVLLER